MIITLCRLLIFFIAPFALFSDYARASPSLSLKQEEVKVFGKLIQPGDKFSPIQALSVYSFIMRYLIADRGDDAYRICSALYQGSDIENIKEGALQCISRSSLMSGNFDRAETIILRAVADSEPLIGRERYRYATNLFILADLYQKRGYFLLADSVLQRSEHVLENEVIPLIPESTIDHQEAKRLNFEDQVKLDKFTTEIQQLIYSSYNDGNYPLRHKITDEINKVTARIIKRNSDQGILLLHLNIIRSRWSIAITLGEDDKGFSLIHKISTLSNLYEGQLIQSSEALSAYYYLVNKSSYTEAKKYLKLAKRRAMSDIGYSFNTPEPLPLTFNIPSASTLFGDAKHSGVIARSLLNIGRIYREEGNIIESRRFINAALAGTRFTSGNESSETANVLYEQALTERQDGKQSISLALFRKALEIVTMNSEDAALLPSGSDIESAGKRKDIAIEIIQLLYAYPQLLPAPQRKEVLFESFQSLHRKSTESSIVSASLQRKLTNPVYRKLLDNYRTNVRKLASIRSEYARLETIAPDIAIGQDKNFNLPRQLQKQQSEVNRLRKILMKANILSAQREKNHTNLLKVQTSLLAGEVILQFVFNDTHGYVLATTHQQQYISVIKTGRTAFRKNVETLLRETSSVPNENLTFSVNIANTLYQQSLADVLSKIPQVKRLLVVADGVWDGLPFSILIVNHSREVKLNDYDKVDWLIRHYEIAYIPSPASLINLRDRPLSMAPSDVLGIGSPIGVFPQSPSRGSFVASFLPQPSGYTTSRTVAVGELEQIENFFAPTRRKMLIGPDATINNLYESHPEKYKILIFATHGYLASDFLEIGEPALLMSTSSYDNKAAFLTTNDIASKNIDANLVLLNACNTAGSDGMPGAESLTGMVNAFFFSGARSVVASLWSVNDRTATTMGIEVIKQSSKNKKSPIGSLLQKTMLTTLKNSQGIMKHPYYWAPYIVIGDPVIVPLMSTYK